MEKKSTHIVEPHIVEEIRLNDHCLGFAEVNNNCWNYSIISTDPDKDVYTNEYLAGVLQGMLQGENLIQASRNNSWNNTYLCSTEHSFPKNLEPSQEELSKAATVLKRNYSYLYSWLFRYSGTAVAEHIKRLLFRMYGIYAGQKGNHKLTVTFEELSPARIDQKELQLGYGQAPLTFFDVYFINAQQDLLDAISTSPEIHYGHHKSDHCSAFIKRTEDDIFWTHNTWSGYLSQTHTLTYLIGDKDSKDFITQNTYCQGQFGSNTDFGFNKHGICFNETTHRYSTINPTDSGIWLCWRAAAAEMFAKDIQDFCRHIMVDNTSTYLNGYMIIDAKTEETALLEMSDKTFAFFHQKKGSEDYTLHEYRTDQDGVLQILEMSKDDYTPDLLAKDYVFGVNYPINYTVANDLGSRDNRPKRRIQFRNEIHKVIDIETTKALITYIEKGEPLSIYGRWDLGHGNAGGYGKVIPDGATDAKAFSVKAVRELLDSMKFQPNKDSDKTSFWMLYGTAKINGEPFVWSKSEWKETKLDHVPDRLEGEWAKVRLFIE
ncbi:MAG: hypothetical protein LBH84_07425 [Prevotellaceae bacterium]|jgi:hypothetical protein|nr:hypothetical protein [Prevotellaceae bacterium]